MKRSSNYRKVSRALRPDKMRMKGEFVKDIVLCVVGMAITVFMCIMGIMATGEPRTVVMLVLMTAGLLFLLADGLLGKLEKNIGNRWK